jgi:hypothetical protein
MRIVHIIEEEILEEPIQFPPDSLLYTVPDTHDNHNTRIAAIDPTKSMEGFTFIVQEEIPMMNFMLEPPPLNLDANCDQILPSLFTLEKLELIF